MKLLQIGVLILSFIVLACEDKEKSGAKPVDESPVSKIQGIWTASDSENTISSSEVDNLYAIGVVPSGKKNQFNFFYCLSSSYGTSGTEVAKDYPKLSFDILTFSRLENGASVPNLDTTLELNVELESENVLKIKELSSEMQGSFVKTDLSNYSSMNVNQIMEKGNYSI